MRIVGQSRTRAARTLIVLLSVSLYICLVILDGLSSIPGVHSHSGTAWMVWLFFGFSAFVAFTFLVVGGFVYLFARNRPVAWLLFSFSIAVMMAFVSETASVLSNAFFDKLSGASSSLAFIFFAFLLLLFPRNLLIRSASGDQGKVRASMRYVRSAYITLLIVLCSMSVLHIFAVDVLWLALGSNIYRLLVMSGIVITIGISYSHHTALRERQQQRIFAFGVLIAFLPLLLLTVLPIILDVPRFSVDPQLSTLTVILLPLTLGYTILRYQVLVFDRYIRRAVAWMTGIIGLFGVGYLVIMISNLLLPGGRTAPIIAAVVMIGIAGPCIWWFARVVTERLFFHEMRHYRRLIDSADLISAEGFDIAEAVQLLTTAALQVFKTQEICLYVLDDDTGTYRLYPALKEAPEEDADRGRLVRRLRSSEALSASASVGGTWINARDPLVERVASSRRSMLLHEFSQPEPTGLLGIRRYILSGGPLDYTDPLLAPIWASGKLIGLLLLGERSDHQQYAGPDLDAVQYLLARFAPALEAARLYAKGKRNASILRALYGGNTLSVQSFTTVEDVARAYTRVAAEAINAGAEIWLYTPGSHTFSPIAREGNGPLLAAQPCLTSTSEQDWQPWFSEGEYAASWEQYCAEAPPCLSETPRFPAAWLPLLEGQERRGVLALTYPRPHFFAQEERHVLGMFARQCAVAIENTRITLELREAYERQQALDQLKDLFVTTASHELRTPLTAVQGYIELLADFGESLDAASQAEFLAKARRGCDELTLMVNNIMDASLVETEAEQIRCSPVTVAGAVQSVLEMFEADFAREQRTVEVSIPPDLSVLADPVRLRQVLLNLLNNTLKFSSPGSRIEIFGVFEDEQVTIAIQDYGLGVPREDQERLFERFVRLERDMNSPVRGAGLGLYICKRLIEGMRGRIWVESSGVVGEGSLFAFSLRPSRLLSRGISPVVERQRA